MPPKGTLARAQIKFAVRWRQLGRVTGDVLLRKFRPISRREGELLKARMRVVEAARRLSAAGDFAVPGDYAIALLELDDELARLDRLEP